MLITNVGSLPLDYSFFILLLLSTNYEITCARLGPCRLYSVLRRQEVSEIKKKHGRRSNTRRNKTRPPEVDSCRVRRLLPHLSVFYLLGLLVPIPYIHATFDINAWNDPDFCHPNEFSSSFVNVKLEVFMGTLVSQCRVFWIELISPMIWNSDNSYSESISDIYRG